MKRGLRLFFVVAVVLTVFAGLRQTAQAQTTNPINHIIVIYMENQSFDKLYGSFPGANGIANAGDTINQVDKNGQPYKTLPAPINTNLKPPAPDTRFPADMAVKPFDIAPYVAMDQETGDLVHRFYQEQYQIDGGKMDKYVAWSDAAGLAMGYYDTTKLPMYKIAQQYTLADNFFHAAFGGSFLNHFWLVCACSPTWPTAPADRIAKLDANGVITADGAVTPDNYVVNTTYSAVAPHPKTPDDHLMPAQTMPTIGDLLSEKNITWTWYAGGWNDAVAGNPDPLYQFHHQPFSYFKNYGLGTDGGKTHLKDEKDFLADLQAGTLPAVSWLKPLGEVNEHPGYATLAAGEQYLADLVGKIQASPDWKDTAIIITYDENGGAWDHVAPPKTDKWGPGTRVPTLIISPYAKKGFVDHTSYDTTSILAFIENRYGLKPLGDRDAKVNNLLNAFDFSQTPSTMPAMASTMAEMPATMAPTASK